MGSSEIEVQIPQRIITLLQRPAQIESDVKGRAVIDGCARADRKLPQTDRDRPQCSHLLNTTKSKQPISIDAILQSIGMVPFENCWLGTLEQKI